MDIISIPKKMWQKGDLVIIPRVEYEEALKVKQRLLWEEEDTDEAIRVFDREKKIGKLKKVSSFSEILHLAKRRAKNAMK